ncbi:MAG: alpha/beta hydrolase fold domain-containing protein [Saccharofermentanales bacterium]
MKISNKIIMGILRLIYFLNPQAKNPDRVYPHAKAHNERQVFKIPKGRKIDCERLDIKTEIGSYPCLRIKKKGQNPDIAVLYICGGGGVYDYCRHQLFLAKKLLKWVDAEIYYPFYPPSTKHPIKEAFKMVFETYRTMLDNYSHKKIGVIGVSFGGTAAMTMISWNNDYKEELPMPPLTIALSPGHVPANPVERDMLEVYRGIDPMVPVDWLETFGRINKGGQDLDHWLIHTAHGDFRNAGKIFLYYGEKESLVFAAPLYQQSLEKAGADYKIHIEPDMPHCYGAVRINKTSKRTYDEIVGLLNDL